MPDCLPLSERDQDIPGRYFIAVGQNGCLRNFRTCLNDFGAAQAIGCLPYVEPRKIRKSEGIQAITNQLLGLLGRGQSIPDNIIKSPE